MIFAGTVISEADWPISKKIIVLQMTCKSLVNEDTVYLAYSTKADLFPDSLEAFVCPSYCL